MELELDFTAFLPTHLCPTYAKVVSLLNQTVSAFPKGAAMLTGIRGNFTIKLYDKSNGPGTYPDLPGGINGGPFKVGLSSDLPLKPDPDLEGTMSSNANFISTKGINQRFGRKFRIVKFRWLRMDEV